MESILNFIKNEPRYRKDQLCRAWFDVDVEGYDKISTLPLELRKKLKKFPWLPVAPEKIIKSKIDETIKTLLKLEDGLFIETVLISRDSKKDEGDGKPRRTICVSSQVGCAMGCLFCATGRLGFKRNLFAEEIIGQYRFWQKYLADEGGSPRVEAGGDIQNIVVMGQGEPLLNYENVKTALSIILKNTKIGPSKITVSTAGIASGMEQILDDPEFPPVRIAISLHSAIEKTRKQIMPSHTEGLPAEFLGATKPKRSGGFPVVREAGFLKFLPKWAKKYHKKFSSRSHFLGLEYVMLKNFNDDDKHLRALISLASNLGSVKINLMPWNQLPFTDSANMQFSGSPDAVIKHWQNKLMKKGFVCTIRHSQGADIAAACGQLATEK